MKAKGAGSAPLSLLLGWRFLRGRGNHLLDRTAGAALIATTLGVTAMIIAMALMSGYREDLRRKLIRGNAAVIAYPLLGSAAQLAPEVVDQLASLPAVTEVRSVVYGQGSLVSDRRPDGIEVTLRGVDSVDALAGLGSVELVDGETWEGDRLLSDAVPGLVAGGELARRLGLEGGEMVRLMVLGMQGDRPQFRYRTARLVGTFTTGFSEFDRSWVVTDRLVLEELLGAESATRLLEVATDEPEMADRIAAAAREALGEDFLITSWRDLNRELFTALEVQQVALFLVLGLIVLVSTFNVASSLVVLVRERMRDIGLLAALGLTPAQLRTVFMLYGCGLGLAGTICGVMLGAASAWVLTEFELIRFDAEVAAIYFISSVPFRVEVTDVVAVSSFTLVVTFLACLAPARRAARLRPARALRYE